MRVWQRGQQPPTISVSESSEGVFTLLGRRNFADVTKLSMLRGGDYPGVSEWAPRAMPVSLQEGGARSERRGDAGPLALKTEEPRARDAAPLEAGKSKRTGLLLEPPEGMQPADHFRLLTSDDTLVLSQVTKCVVICDNSSRKSYRGKNCRFRG